MLVVVYIRFEVKETPLSLEREEYLLHLSNTAERTLTSLCPFLLSRTYLRLHVRMRWTNFVVGIVLSASPIPDMSQPATKV